MPDALEFFEQADIFFQLYWEGKYTDALALAEKLSIVYPEKDARTVFWLVCLQNLNGQSAQALQTFKEALARGVWWAEAQLRSDPDLTSLQGNEEFERLVKHSEAMHLEAEANAKPAMAVHQPDGAGPFPLLICLGPRGGYPELDFRDWSPVIKLGWVLALPRSTQMASPLSHVWDDREKALNEIAGHFEMLIKKYPIDRDRIVMAGFSQGATRAIELVMSRRLKASGFIAVVPGTLDPAELESWAASGACKAKGVLVSGGKDPRYEMFVQLKERFAKRNIPLLFEHHPEMGHQIPNNFELVLDRSLAFLCNTEKENE